MHQYPAKDVIAALKEEHSDDVVGYEHAMAAKRGPLFKIDWYRVILDEVHAIKNANGRSKCSLEASTCCRD